MGFFNERQKAKIKKEQELAWAAARKAAQAADQQTDSWLIKVSQNKWTWAIVAGIIIAAWLLGFIQG